MGNVWTLVTCGVVGLLGLTVWASEKPPADFANAMRTIAAAQAAAAKATEAENFDAAEKNAATIVEAFPTIEKYWASRSPDVLPMVRVASKAASELRVPAQLCPEARRAGVAWSSTSAAWLHGRELRVLMAGDLLWSQVFRPGDSPTLAEVAAAGHARLLAHGWEPAE